MVIHTTAFPDIVQRTVSKVKVLGCMVVGIMTGLTKALYSLAVGYKMAGLIIR